MGDFQPKSGWDEPLPELEPLQPEVWEKPRGWGSAPYGSWGWMGLCTPIWGLQSKILEQLCPYKVLPHVLPVML